MLKIQNLTLKQHNKILCDNLNFTIQAGEIWGILGPNGCGKTTLLHTLAGLLPADGSIFLKNTLLKNFTRKEIAKNIGLLLQNTEDRFPQTVLEYCQNGRYPHLSYMGLPSKTDRDFIHHALKMMELEHLSNQNIQTLSGGERRRLSIATLLVQSPCIYLLDEPTNHLDLRHQIQTLQFFHHLARTQSISICIALHDINLAAEFCDHVLLLNADAPLVGKTNLLLSEENLSRLYRQPLIKRLGFYPY